MTATLNFTAQDAKLSDTALGCVRLLYFYDVAEEIDLPVLRTLIAASGTLEKCGPAAEPPCIQFERTPVVELLEPLLTTDGSRWNARLKYHEYGVITLELERAFQLEWSRLLVSHAGWTTDIRLDRHAREVSRKCLERIRVALRKPYNHTLGERYVVVEIGPEALQPGVPVTACKLTETRSTQFAQMIRGEASELSEEETAHVLQFRMSYHPSDLVVVGSEAAIVCDTPSGAGPTLEVLEYATIQLLELKHYDEVLTNL